MQRFALVLALLLTPAGALADVPPPNACSDIGSDCATAPPDYKTAGVCTKTTCSEPAFKGGGSHDCNLCLPGKSGAKKQKKSGCATSPGPANGSGAWLGLLAAVLVLRRTR